MSLQQSHDSAPDSVVEPGSSSGRESTGAGRLKELAPRVPDSGPVAAAIATAVSGSDEAAEQGCAEAAQPKLAESMGEADAPGCGAPQRLDAGSRDCSLLAGLEELRVRVASLEEQVRQQQQFETEFRRELQAGRGNHADIEALERRLTGKFEQRLKESIWAAVGAGRALEDSARSEGSVDIEALEARLSNRIKAHLKESLDGLTVAGGNDGRQQQEAWNEKFAKVEEMWRQQRENTELQVLENIDMLRNELYAECNQLVAEEGKKARCGADLVLGEAKDAFAAQALTLRGSVMDALAADLDEHIRKAVDIEPVWRSLANLVSMVDELRKRVDQQPPSMVEDLSKRVDSMFRFSTRGTEDSATSP